MRMSSKQTWPSCHTVQVNLLMLLDISCCFGYFNIIRPPPGVPAEADQTPACVEMANCSVPPGAPLLSHSHHQPHSAASVVLRMAAPFLFHSMPKKLKAVPRDSTATSTVKRKLSRLHLLSSSRFLSLSIATFQRHFQLHRDKL